MKAGTAFLLLWNTIALIPVALHMLAWMALTFGLGLLIVVRDRPLPLFALLLVGGVTVFVSSIVGAIRLKLRILRRFGSKGSGPIRSLYRAASRVNLLFYLLYYPLIAVTFGWVALSDASRSGLEGLLIALIALVSLPVFWKVRSLRRRFIFLAGPT